MSSEEALRQIAIAQQALDRATQALTSPPPAGLPGLTDSVSHPPPAAGPYAYDTFSLPVIPGQTYRDPVFQTPVLRLTADHAHDDLYGRNMLFSADQRLYLHRTADLATTLDAWSVVDVPTGLVTHAGIPFGYYAADGGFDPVRADVLYALVRDRGDGLGEIQRVTLRPNGAWILDHELIVPGLVSGLGGSTNWFDASGRFMLVRYGPEPSAYVFDRENMSAGPYAGAIDAHDCVERGGYLGLSPDAQYVVGFDSRTGVGVAGVGQALSWRIDHASRRVLPANVCWSLCGDHAAILSASDGRTYMITYDCYDHAALWRVDVANNAAGLDATQQRVLPHNQRLLAFPTWDDFGHIASVARGAYRDWAIVSTEDATDVNGSSSDSAGNVTPWHAYRQEILAVQVLTGEVRRLVHHRSRMGGDYYSQPRVAVSWSGATIAFASNFNQPDRSDVYAVAFAPAERS